MTKRFFDGFSTKKDKIYRYNSNRKRFCNFFYTPELIISLYNEGEI
jgi:hypothetical protein